MTDRRSPTWRLLMLMLGAIALLGLVAAAACGDDDGGDDGGGDPAATMDDFDGDDGGDDGEGDGDGGSDSLAELAAFGGDYESYTGKVTYDISDFDTGDGAGLGGVSTMTIYQKGGSSRLDISSPDGDIIFINTADASYLCSGGADCLKYSADDETAGAAVSVFSALFSDESINQMIGDIPNGLDFDATSETIAGLDATCFKTTGDLDPTEAGDETSEFCFSDGGLMLRLAFGSGGLSSSFEASSASEDVPDSDFDPPFPVTDLGDLGDIFTP